MALAVVALAPHPAFAEDAGGVTQIDQIGNANEATIQQKFVASGGFADKLNSATVSQTGTGNTIGIIQEGASLNADVTQDGENLSATVDQSGTGHTATVEQFGSSLGATVQQSGQTPHGITITQDNIYGNTVTDNHGTTTYPVGPTVTVTQTD
jgi:hypothetical protein